MEIFAILNEYSAILACVSVSLGLVTVGLFLRGSLACAHVGVCAAGLGDSPV